MKHDVLMVFLSTLALSCCLTVGFLLYRVTHLGPGIPVIGADYEGSTFASGSTRFRTSRQAFLAGMLSDQASELRSQVRFISSIIKAHRSPPSVSDQLAYLIVSESLKAGYDPLFIAAVIRSESTFRQSAISHKGAQGLMQIMPGTGQYVSKLHNLKWSGVRTLHDPNTNLRLGIAYLQYLERKFKGNLERVLVAYNWGPANVEQAVKFRQPMPYESIKYARRIISTHRQWRNEWSRVASNTTPSLLTRLLG